MGELPKRDFGGLVATLIVVVVCAAVADRPASASGLPELPSLSVVLPEPPAAPSLPSLPPLPPVTPPPVPIPVPVPSVPVPLPPSGAPPAPAQRQILPLPAAQVAEIADAVTQHASDVAAPGASAGQAAPGDDRRRGAPGRRSRKAHALPYGKRLRLVHALRGCLDQLPARQSDALILRYGIGDLARRRARQAAAALHVSLERFRVIHRRGMRNLLNAAQGGSCENGRIAAETMASAYNAAWRATVSGAAISVAARRDTEREGGAVLGVQRSSDDEHRSDSEGAEPGGSRAATVFGGVSLETDDALLIALLAIMLAGATWIILSFARALR